MAKSETLLLVVWMRFVSFLIIDPLALYWPLPRAFVSDYVSWST